MNEFAQLKLDALCRAPCVAIPCDCVVRDGTISMPLQEFRSLVVKLEAIGSLLKMRDRSLSDPYHAEDGLVSSAILLRANGTARPSKRRRPASSARDPVAPPPEVDSQNVVYSEAPSLTRNSDAFEAITEVREERREPAAVRIPQEKLDRLMARGPDAAVLDGERIPWAAGVTQASTAVAPDDRPTFVLLVADPQEKVLVTKGCKGALLKIPEGADLKALAPGALAIAEGGGRVVVGIVDPPTQEQPSLFFGEVVDPD